VLTPLQIATLGVLAEEPRHPYDCYRLLLHRRADRVVRIKTGTLYHAISRLEAEGLVAEVGTDREGNRPERTTYRITPEGRAALETAIAGMLEAPADTFPQFALGLAEASVLPAHEVVRLLRIRVANVRELLAEVEAGIGDVRGRALPRRHWVDLEYSRAMLQAKVAWIDALVADLEGGALPWDDDDTTACRAAEAPTDSADRDPAAGDPTITASKEGA
jgi:DNA-binding PadR family transcriptional regulator